MRSIALVVKRITFASSCHTCVLIPFLFSHLNRSSRKSFSFFFRFLTRFMTHSNTNGYYYLECNPNEILLQTIYATYMRFSFHFFFSSINTSYTINLTLKFRIIFFHPLKMLLTFPINIFQKKFKVATHKSSNRYIHTYTYDMLLSYIHIYQYK